MMMLLLLWRVVSQRDDNLAQNFGIGADAVILITIPKNVYITSRSITCKWLENVYIHIYYPQYSTFMLHETIGIYQMMVTEYTPYNIPL